MEQRIALSHASGLAAEAILERFAESSIPTEALLLLDAAAGKRLPFRKSYLACQDQAGFDFSNCALMLMAEADDGLADRAEAAGCTVASHALADEIPAVFAAAGDEPEIPFNATRLRLAGPALASLAPVLREIDRWRSLARLNTVLLQSAEFHGKAGVDELASQTISLLNSRKVTPAVYSEQIAFNLVSELADPRFGADLARILGNSSYSFAQQSINVPVFHGFAAAVQAQFADEVRAEDCIARLGGLENVVISECATSPVSDCNQSFSCVISHLEQAQDHPSSIQFWLSADPMRYGLATNYLHVTEFLLKSFL